MLFDRNYFFLLIRFIFCKKVRKFLLLRTVSIAFYMIRSFSVDDHAYIKYSTHTSRTLRIHHVQYTVRILCIVAL